ncbi:MAG TPA: tail fiber protein [Sphingomonas sp.]|nr:tail fiber protein [Sphingomonas sp.]
MATPFIGQLMTVGFNFAPRNWATCSGQILSIAQNTALFSLLGTTYGGNGQTTFALPDLRGRAAMGWGQGPGLSNRSLGEVGGTENTTLISTNMPSHTHTLTPVTVNAVNIKASEQAPQAGAYLGRGVDTATTPDSIPEIYVPASAVTTQPLIPLGGVNSAGTTGVSGNSIPFSTMQPYLVLTQVIALQGIFPSRN